MKTNIALIGLCVVFCGHALAQTNQILPVINPGNAHTPFDSSHVKTISGGVYDKIEVSKIEPDGVVVCYTPKGGGMAIAKIYFEDLPEEWREHYGYNSERAKKFEVQRQQDTAQMRLQMIADDQNSKQIIAAREAAEEEADRQAKIEAQKEADEQQKIAAAEKAAQAAMIQATNPAHMNAFQQAALIQALNPPIIKQQQQ